MPRSILDMLRDLYNTVKPSARDFGDTIKDFLFGVDLETKEGLEALKQKLISQNRDLSDRMKKNNRIIDEINEKLRTQSYKKKDPFEGYDPNHPFDDWDYWERVYEKSRSGYQQHSKDGRRTYSRENPAIREHYKTLGLKYGEPIDVVKKAWRKLIEQYHPDKFNNDPSKYQNALELTKMVNEAYQSISRWLESQA